MLGSKDVPEWNSLCVRAIQLANGISGASKGRFLGRSRLAKFIMATCAALPLMGMAGLNEQDYMPDVIQRLDRAKSALESGQLSIALANTRVILHDQGLKVYMDLSATPENQVNDCKNASAKALKFWNETLDNSCPLTFVDRADQADVKIVFQQSVTLDGVQVGGYCENARSVSVRSNGEADAVYSGTIFARFTQPNGRPMSYAHLVNVVTHEFGHVFGLSDTADQSHLMGPLNLGKPKSELNAEEVEAIRRLRTMAFDIQRNVLAKAKGL